MTCRPRSRKGLRTVPVSGPGGSSRGSGGLGGWQNGAVLLHPSDWTVDDDLLDRSVPGEAVLYGAEAVHRQLVRRLERSGARRPLGGLSTMDPHPAARPCRSTTGARADRVADE